MEAQLVDKIEKMATSWEEFKAAHKLLQEEVKTMGVKDGVLEESIKKATESVATQHEEVVKLTKQYEDIGTRLSRITTESEEGGKKSRKALRQEREDALTFKRTVLAARSELKLNTNINADEALTEYKAFNEHYTLLLRKGEKVLTQEQIKALSVGSDIDGGFFVRPVWSQRIITKVFESSPVRQLATVETVSGPELKYPVDVGEADAGWVAETAARNVTATAPVQEKSIVAHELYALPKATQSILEDAGVDVEAWLMDKVGQKFARVEATAFISGNGVGKPRGLLSYPNGTAWGQIEQVGSGSSGLFTFTGLTKIVGSLKEEHHANARWLLRRETLPSIMLLQDGAGRYVFQPIFTLGYSNMPLMGYPITYAHDIPLASAGSNAAIFGDIKTAYTVVDRLGISMLRDPYLYKPFIGFYTRKRVGGDVLNFEAYKIMNLA